ncbi:hypothetical protein BDF14DRAFT_1770296 [Spinellus fusiger]|nr:hypothetical protein BDF14DRAFT_1770296 [Spinellus fusiger]
MTLQGKARERADTLQSECGIETHTSDEEMETGQGSKEVYRKGKAKAKVTRSQERDEKSAADGTHSQHQDKLPTEEDTPHASPSCYTYLDDDLEVQVNPTMERALFGERDMDTFDEEDWENDAFDEEEEEEEEDVDDDVDDDDDEEEREDDEREEEAMTRARQTLGFQMQDIFDDMSSNITGRLRSILNNLKRDDDPTLQLIALQELAEILSVSNEDILAGFFTSDSFVKELMRIIKGPEEEMTEEEMMIALAMNDGYLQGNPETMLLACRCIANLLDIVPTATTSVAYRGGVRILCQKLKSIEYMDLAEQALCALERVAAHLPRAVVNEGGLNAVFMFFDFFNIHTQRTALRTAANCMRGIDTGTFDQIMEVVPNFTGYINYPDRTIVELACLCWVRLAESYRNHKELLEKAIQPPLLHAMMQLLPVSGNPNAVRSSTFTDLLRFFRSVAKSSPTLACELLKIDIIGIFYQILTNTAESPTLDSAPVHTQLDSKWRDSAPTITKIVADLLPHLPKGNMFSSKRFKEHEPIATRTRSKPTVTTIDPIVETDPRMELFKEQPELLKRIDGLLVPLLLEIYTSTVNVRVRQYVSHILAKIVYFTDAPTLRSVLKDIEFSGFLASTLAQQEHPTLVMDSLYMAEILGKKLPDIYHSMFEREGVLHEIELLANRPLVDTEAPTEQSTNSVGTGPSASVHDQDTREDSVTSSSKGNDPTHSDTSVHSSQENEKRQSEKASLVSARRRFLEKEEINALLRQRAGHTHSVHQSENEKGIGSGSTRRHIVLLAQHLVSDHHKQSTRSEGDSVSSLNTIRQLASDLLLPFNDNYAQVIKSLLHHLEDSTTSISSFELVSSGLLDSLLLYLTETADTFSTPLIQRRTLFRQLLIETGGQASHSGGLVILVTRLQEILSRVEPFEVVVPLDSGSLDTVRNSTSMLTKQIRLRLTSKGVHIPREYDNVMVSTHAIASFRMIEQYLLTRIHAAETLDTKADCSHQEKKQDAYAMEVDPQSPEPSQKEDTNICSDSVDSVSSHSSSTGGSTQQKDGKWQILFTLRNTPVTTDTTIYGAIHEYETRFATPNVPRSVWTTAHPVTYERVWVPTPLRQKTPPTATQPTPHEKPETLVPDSVCTKVLSLLKALSQLNQGPVEKDTVAAVDIFMNRKLTAKMNQQLEEPLIVASACLPRWTYWLMSEAPFLFPFETRFLFIQSTSFGYSRLIARWESLQLRNTAQNGSREDPPAPVLGRLERQKFKVVRTEILEYAMKLLDLYGNSQTVLEIEYEGEEGTGLGPSLEFYTLASREFYKKSIGLWRDEEEDNEGLHVSARLGLFPKPLPKHAPVSTEKILNLFKALGQFVAKAMLDFRMIDIPFSPAFFKAVFGEMKDPSKLLQEIDPVLSASVNALQAYVDQKKAIYADITMSMSEQVSATRQITVKGALIEDLCLDFTLPGDVSIELKSGGKEIPVTISNVEEYIELLKDALVGSGISQQLVAFRKGFNGLFAIDDLKVLTYQELVALFGKASEDWSYSTLADTIKVDHGFTMESPIFRYLLEYLSELDENQRREFLQFTTGSPRLPIGGWKAIRPVFTVVRKVPEHPLKADDYLPSVMTCANYLKMPEYSTKKVMQQRIVQSITEGKNSFLLS